MLLDPLKPSFYAHSLQIHCVGLFGPEFLYLLGLGIKTLPLQIVFKLYIYKLYYTFYYIFLSVSMHMHGITS